MAKFKSSIPYSAPSIVADLPAPELPSCAFYRVARECRVPQGSSYYVLPEGKVISSCGYDIAELLRMGVPLERSVSHVTVRKATVT